MYETKRWTFVPGGCDCEKMYKISHKFRSYWSIQNTWVNEKNLAQIVTVRATIGQPIADFFWTINIQYLASIACVRKKGKTFLAHNLKERIFIILSKYLNFDKKLVLN